MFTHSFWHGERLFILSLRYSLHMCDTVRLISFKESSNGQPYLLLPMSLIWTENALQTYQLHLWENVVIVLGFCASFRSLFMWDNIVIVIGFCVSFRYLFMWETFVIVFGLCVSFIVLEKGLKFLHGFLFIGWSSGKTRIYWRCSGENPLGSLNTNTP